MKRALATFRASARLAALSDALRLRICQILKKQELTVGELSRVLQAPQSTTSRHLKVLSDAGWTRGRADGVATFYRLDVTESAAQRLLDAATEDFAAEAGDQISEDGRRLAAVLAERRTDSLSYFGRVAGEWDEVRGELFGRSFGLQALLGLLPSDWTVADVGCGTGANAAAIAPYVREVVCIDQSQPMLDAARLRLADFSNVRFEQGPIEALPLENASVDAAMCFLVMHFLDEPAEGLRELRRIVRAPRGVALIVDMHPHDRGEYRHTMGHKHLGFAPQRMRELCRAAGFDDVRIAPLPSDPNAKGPGLYGVTAR